MVDPTGSRTTRRQFVGTAGAALAVLAAAPSALGARTRLGSPDASRRTNGAFGTYLSRPDLQPPIVRVATQGRPSPGLVFVAPFELAAATDSGSPAAQYGGLIIDNAGHPVWFRPTKEGLTTIDLRVQRYRGRPVLTWYEGKVLGGYGGEFVIADDTYRVIARVRAGNGYRADLHECLLTRRGTALITIYNQLTTDLTSIGGPVNGELVEGVVQELELPSGRVLFEWHSLDHVAPTESYATAVTAAGNVDYFHLNSIGVDYDGHLLVSARNTSAVYKISRTTGQLIWRLGGKVSDFEMGPGTTFSWQHDARRHPDRTLTLFDNAAFAPGPNGADKPSSRPIRLALDMAAMTATLTEEYPSGMPRSAFAMGNMQQLPDRGAFVGWGTEGSFSEIDTHGATRFDGRFDPGIATYRAYRSRWTGRPATKPDLVTRVGFDGEEYAYVSWNGATEVTGWRLLAGTDPDQLGHVRTVARGGFETAISLRDTRGTTIAVAALDAKRRVLGTSAPRSL
jgi:Arylsulfotransferase (ASST)